MTERVKGGGGTGSTPARASLPRLPVPVDVAEDPDAAAQSTSRQTMLTAFSTSGLSSVRASL